MMFEIPEGVDETYHLLNMGLALYGAGHPFEAHEAWEYAWQAEVGRTKLTLQALIQIAAGLHKHRIGNPRGTCKLLAKADEKLDEVRSGCSAWMGIDIVTLQANLKKALEAADAIAAGQTTDLTPPPLPEAASPDRILYLHGFASGPSSAKAAHIVPALRERGFSVAVPDLNEDDFFNLTVSRALALAKRQLSDRTLVVGSSFGGYLGALLALADDRVKALVLMAPAFEIGGRLASRYGEEALAAWKETGRAPVEHYAYGGTHDISYGMFEDAQRHPGRPRLVVPTYILQGANDDVVPAQLVREVAEAGGPRVKLDVVDDAHGLVGHAHLALEAALAFTAQLGMAPAPAPQDAAQILADWPEDD